MSRKPRVERTPEEKWEVVLEGLRSGNIAETCRRYGIAPNLYYRWKDYFNLLQSFRETLQPVGGLEEFLVEKLAQLAWRKARADRAEVAIILRQTEFLSQDHEARLKAVSEAYSALHSLD